MILYLFFKLACLAICMTLLTPMRYPARKSAVYIIAVQILILLANWVLYLLAGEPVYGEISLFTIAIPGFFCFYAVS